MNVMLRLQRLHICLRFLRTHIAMQSLQCSLESHCTHTHFVMRSRKRAARSSAVCFSQFAFCVSTHTQQATTRSNAQILMNYLATSTASTSICAQMAKMMTTWHGDDYGAETTQKHVCRQLMRCVKYVPKSGAKLPHRQRILHSIYKAFHCSNYNSTNTTKRPLQR